MMKASLSLAAGSILEAKPSSRASSDLFSWITRARSPAVLVVMFDRATSIHSSPTVSRSSSGISGADDSMPVDNVCSMIAGIFRAGAFASPIGFRVNPPCLAYCSKLLSFIGRKQFLQRRTGRRHLDSRGGIRRVADVEKVAHKGRAVVALGPDRDLSFSSARRAI